MIVVDASCLLELLLNRPGAQQVLQVLADHDELCAPGLIDVEVCHILRRYALHREISVLRGKEAVEELAEFPLERYPHTLLVKRMWQLRNNLTAYDAAYVSLAEALDVALVTCDQKLAGVKGHRAKIEVVGVT